MWIEMQVIDIAEVIRLEEKEENSMSKPQQEGFNFCLWSPPSIGV